MEDNMGMVCRRARIMAGTWLDVPKLVAVLCLPAAVVLVSDLQQPYIDASRLRNSPSTE